MTATTIPANLANLEPIFSGINLTSRQQEYLTEFIIKYNQKTKKSKKFAMTHSLGLADNKSFVDFQLPLKEINYSIVTQKSYGSTIEDIDGNKYIDLVMGYGVNLFGHNPDFVKQEILGQLNKGIQLGSQPELIGEVTDLIKELTGVARVAFSNTGTEAVMTAIRLARTVTGRNKIVMGGMLVVIADLLGRVLFAPLELPCGIITAAVGAPYFVYLLVKNRQL